MIDVSYQMKVQPNVSFDRLISLFPNLSQDEIDELINYIQTTGTFIFRNIIPKDTKFYFIEWVDE
jgi:hypothetical protein